MALDATWDPEIEREGPAPAPPGARQPPAFEPPATLRPPVPPPMPPPSHTYPGPQPPMNRAMGGPPMTAWRAPAAMNGIVPRHTATMPIVRNSQPVVLGLERDTGMMPWWAWASIGAVVVFCGMLVIAAVGGQHSTGDASFDPHAHVGYSDMTILPTGGLFEGTVDFVTWTVDVEGAAWDAGAQANESTSMPAPGSGMKYVGIDLTVESIDHAALVEDALLFSYITPNGQEYTQHYCGTGCLSSAGGAEYEYGGWLYFEVPEKVPEGGYLRVNLIRSPAHDTLMELP